MCVGPAKPAEHLVLPALFFGSFFWASKRKNNKNTLLNFHASVSNVLNGMVLKPLFPTFKFQIITDEIF
jgi:hypothetical protein